MQVIQNNDKIRRIFREAVNKGIGKDCNKVAIVFEREVLGGIKAEVRKNLRRASLSILRNAKTSLSHV
jgi:hypothetical protein